MWIFQWMPWYFVPMMVIGFALPIFFVVRLMKGSAERNRILARGVAAQATIMRIWETGMRVNDSPQVGFQLQVTAPTGHVWAAETKMIVSQLMIPRIQPGAVVAVKYDPMDPTKVALDL